jgi:hypothetical protein
VRHDADDFREEPGAGKPHARICEGEAEWPSYSTTTHHPIIADIATDPPQRRSAAHNPARHSETLSSRTPFGRAASFQGIWIPHSLRSALALNGPSFTHLDDCRPNRPTARRRAAESIVNRRLAKPTRTH